MVQNVNLILMMRKKHWGGNYSTKKLGGTCGDKLCDKRIESLEHFRKRFGYQEADEIVKIPWFYQCNPGRYPGFKRELDMRLF